ncbi:MAG: hypothetical protein IPH75_09000 [bacterium]|nr:hypothetical protein [bacterium]
MSAILGIDLRGPTICTASVGETNGRRTILWLAQAPVSERMQYPDKVTLALAIPDDSVMVKYYQMPTVAGSDVELRLQFEMEQSLLDDADQFRFDTIRTSLPDRYLGLICRKSGLAALQQRLAISEEAPSISLARGVALARGFRAFCKVPGGELIGLVDITPDSLSLCLLYRAEIIALGHLKLEGYEPADEMSVKRLAMEIKTLVSFKLASVAEMGLSIPMSSLSLSGDFSDQLLEQIERYFPTGVHRVEVNRAALGPGLEMSNRPELFLPALGMTVI